MIRDIIEEAASLTAIGLFVFALSVWANIISSFVVW